MSWSQSAALVLIEPIKSFSSHRAAELIRLWLLKVKGHHSSHYPVVEGYNHREVILLFCGPPIQRNNKHKANHGFTEKTIINNWKTHTSQMGADISAACN